MMPASPFSKLVEWVGEAPAAAKSAVAGAAASMDAGDKAALALSTVPVVGDVAGVANDVRNYITGREETTPFNVGMTLADALIPFVPKGTIPNALGIIVGRKSKKWDRRAEERAQILLDDLSTGGGINPNTGKIDPADAQAIYEKRGIYFSDKDQPMSMISDKDSKLDVGKVVNGAKMKLSELFEHPELYDHYPELRDLAVRIVPKDSRYHGAAWYDPKEGMPTAYVEIAEGHTPRSLKNTLLHEVNHIIQGVENFSLGSAPGSADSIKRWVNSLPPGTKTAPVKNAGLDVWEEFERLDGNAQLEDLYGLRGARAISREMRQGYATVDSVTQLEEFSRNLGAVGGFPTLKKRIDAALVEAKKLPLETDHQIYERMGGEARSRQVEEVSHIGSDKIRTVDMSKMRRTNGDELTEADIIP